MGKAAELSDILADIDLVCGKCFVCFESWKSGRAHGRSSPFKTWKKKNGQESKKSTLERIERLVRKS